MQIKLKCDCGNNKFLICTEKMYEGYINEDGILVCEPDEQHIEAIKCSMCSKDLMIKDFRGIEY